MEAVQTCVAEATVDAVAVVAVVADDEADIDVRRSLCTQSACGVERHTCGWTGCS